MQYITKLCSDHLRFIAENHGVKLKASHAHELVAAFFGYKSRAAMLANKQYPLSNLTQAEIIVMPSTDFIDQRRTKLHGLSPELPDSHTLGVANYQHLSIGEWWTSPYPPFKNFEDLAKYLVDNNEAYKNAFKFYRDVPVHHIVEIKDGKDVVTLTVLHCHRTSDEGMVGVGQTTIKLQYVVAYIGYGKPQISVELWTGGARKTIANSQVKE